MGLLDFVPIIGPAISAVGSIISGNNANDTNSANTAATNAANVALADKTNNFNAQQAQINRDYQTEMSNTAVQRRTADLTAAGINPILAAGSDASSPGGSSATGTMPTQQAYHSNPVNGAEAGINSAYQALQLKGALQKIRLK